MFEYATVVRIGAIWGTYSQHRDVKEPIEMNRFEELLKEHHFRSILIYLFVVSVNNF